MNNWQRDLAYGTGCLVIGLAVMVFTHKFIVLADSPGFRGYFTLFAFGIGFFSLSFAINRRFMLKSDRHMVLNFFFAFLIIAPTLFWTFGKIVEIDNTRLTFVLVSVFGAFLGAYAGTRYGVAKRNMYIERIKKQQEEELPDDLKRPHDDLSKN